MKEENIRRFNYAVRQVIRQGKRSIINGFCTYRGEEGSRCAIGWLIDDKTANKHNNKLLISLLDDADGECWLSQLSKEEESIFIDLQDAHDCSGDVDFVKDFKERVEALRKEYNIPEDDKFIKYDVDYFLSSSPATDKVVETV